MGVICTAFGQLAVNKLVTVCASCAHLCHHVDCNFTECANLIDYCPVLLGLLSALVVVPRHVGGRA